MAVYDTPAFDDPPKGFPLNFVYDTVKYTVGSSAITSSDYIRVKMLPKGAQMIPALCSVYADADPDSANDLTVKLEITDGTTTKTLISSSNFQAIDTRITPSAADITGLGLFKTSNDDFYLKFTPTAGGLDAAAVIYFEIAYTNDPSRDAATS